MNQEQAECSVCGIWDFLDSGGICPQCYIERKEKEKRNIALQKNILQEEHISENNDNKCNNHRIKISTILIIGISGVCSFNCVNGVNDSWQIKILP